MKGTALAELQVTRLVSLQRILNRLQNTARVLDQRDSVRGAERSRSSPLYLRSHDDALSIAFRLNVDGGLVDESIEANAIRHDRIEALDAERLGNSPLASQKAAVVANHLKRKTVVPG